MSITESIQAVRADLAGLTVFSHLRDHSLLGTFATLLDAAATVPGSAIAGSGTTYALNLVGSWAAFITACIEEFACAREPYGSRSNFKYSREGSFRQAIAFLTLTADNSFTLAAEASAPVEQGQTHEAETTAAERGLDKLTPLLRIAAAGDLNRLGRIASFDLAALGFHLGGILRDAGLGEAAQNIEAEARAFWVAEGDTATLRDIFPLQNPGDWGAALPELTEHIRSCGAGSLGLYRFFSWAGGDAAQRGSIAAGNSDTAGYCPAARTARTEQIAVLLRPVRNSDPIRLSDLSGYEDQKSVVIANTLRFLEGSHANNLLLYGDRGTGKSATVKAICNEYADQGLRLLEVRKSDLLQLPGILDTLANRRLPFIIFIDDLSFETIDDSFTGLKALLEGGVEARPENVVVYATSNRRHLVKERIADRPGLAAGNPADGEVRAFDTMQEQFSLADRFGLTVVYTSPNQDEYLNIACFIAEKRGLLKSAAADSSAQAEEARQQFRANALRWEKWFNGRSPRTAAQYVDWAAAGADFPWEACYG
jgi:predicted AAA+ superfamily ATPase